MSRVEYIQPTPVPSSLGETVHWYLEQARRSLREGDFSTAVRPLELALATVRVAAISHERALAGPIRVEYPE